MLVVAACATPLAGATEGVVQEARQVDGPQHAVHVVALGAHPLAEAPVLIDRLLGDDPQIVERRRVDRLPDAGVERLAGRRGRVAGAARDLRPARERARSGGPPPPGRAWCSPSAC